MCFILFASTVNAFSQATVDVTPSVKSVTVYLSGAVITHEVKVDLAGGQNNVVFHGLPSRIDAQTIELASSGDLTILSVSNHRDYMTARKKEGRTKEWQDSLDMLNENLERINNGMDILNESKKMLDNNRTVGGVNTGTTVTNLKPMYDYYVSKVTRIDDSLIYLSKKAKNLNARINRIQTEMNEWRNRTDTLTSQVEALVSSDKAQTVTFRISYLAYDAGWNAVYDLRVSRLKEPAKLAYKANVFQHTGEDWKEVSLTLSTANPRVSQTAPVLNPWYLQYYIPATTYNYQNGATMEAPMAAAGNANHLADVEKSEVVEQRPIANTTSENQVNVEFHIDVPYSLPSDNKPHVVEIKNYDLNPIYHNRSVPKLDPSVFLMADITQWENLNLMPGEVSIYYSGAYVGKSYVNTQNPDDTLSFSLGRDKKIQVKRERVKDLSATKWIGATKSQAFSYTISLYNGHSDTLSVDVSDQVPLTTDKDIQIDVLDKGGANLDATTGKLSWKVFLKAGETKKLTFSYTVKYPKDKTIQNLW
jgi:uncharacterized protein (TIGR02231 family)